MTIYRGGDWFVDAMGLLGDARADILGHNLKDFYIVSTAHKVLHLPSGLSVPDGLSFYCLKNFNNDQLWDCSFVLLVANVKHVCQLCYLNLCVMCTTIMPLV